MHRYNNPVKCVAVLVAVVLGWTLLAGGGDVRTTTTAATSRSQPTTYPSTQLVRASDAAAKVMLARLDGSFHAAVHPPFVVIGNMPARRVEAMARDSVVRPAKAMWCSYFRKKPAHVITILLFRDAKTYKHWAKKLYKDAAPPYFGYYRPRDRTMVMNIATGTGTLVHELTHALIVYDFPAVPLWFNEGLASLHEQCRVRPEKIIGLVNWRLPALQNAVRAKKLRPLRELVTRDDFYGRQRGLNYAQARYFVMYMQKRGLLRKFYTYFRDNHTGKDAAVKAVEHVFDAKLEKVESDYLKWVMTLRRHSQRDKGTEHLSPATGYRLLTTTRSVRRRAYVRCPSFFYGPRGRLWHRPVARSARRIRVCRGYRGLRGWVGPSIRAFRPERTSTSHPMKHRRSARDIRAGLGHGRTAPILRVDAGYAFGVLSVSAEPLVISSRHRRVAVATIPTKNPNRRILYDTALCRQCYIPINFVGSAGVSRTGR